MLPREFCLRSRLIFLALYLLYIVYLIFIMRLKLQDCLNTMQIMGFFYLLRIEVLLYA